jgi:hypothetical protein
MLGGGVERPNEGFFIELVGEAPGPFVRVLVSVGSEFLKSQAGSSVANLSSRMRLPLPQAAAPSTLAMRNPTSNSDKVHLHMMEWRFDRSVEAAPSQAASTRSAAANITPIERLVRGVRNAEDRSPRRSPNFDLTDSLR